MPTELKLTDAENLRVLLSDKTVCDPSVGPALGEATLDAGQTFAGDVLSVNVQGALGLFAFNSSDDIDDDGIVGLARGPAPVDKLPPQVALRGGKAFLKYRASAGIKARVAGETLERLGFDIDTRFALVLAHYRLHTCAETVRQAVLGDVRSLRTSLKLDDVLDLPRGEAVSQQVVGTLSVAVEVSWSDVFTSAVGPLTRLAGAGVSVFVKIGAAASLQATVAVTDEFLLVFSRPEAARWRVGLQKARTRSAAIGIDLGVTVTLADSELVEDVVMAALEGVVGQPLDAVEAAIAKGSVDRLSAIERRIVEFLIERFGLSRAADVLERIGERIGAARRGVKDAVRAVAAAKIAVAFGYEYRRMRQDLTITQCLLDEAGLRTHHGDLVRGRIDPILRDASKGAAGVALEHHLYQKTVRSEQSWGFSLSIGKWLALGGADRKSLTKVERRSSSGAVQRAYLGTRGYRHEGERRDLWSADLAVSMPGYAIGAEPVVSEFETGLALNWFEPPARLDRDTLAAWLDLAVLWGATSSGELTEWQARLGGGVKKKCSLVAQLTFPHQAFSIMRPLIAGAEASALGPALGAAMPWMDQRGRRSAGERRAIYGPLWAQYLSDPDHSRRSGRDFAPAARTHLEQHGFGELAAMERLYEITTTIPHDADLFCGLIDLNPRTLQQCHDFLNAVRRLHGETVSAVPERGAMARAFEGMEEFWAQAHHVRSVGRFLLDLAASTAVLTHVTRALSITIGEGDKADVVVIAS